MYPLRTRRTLRLRFFFKDECRNDYITLNMMRSNLRNAPETEKRVRFPPRTSFQPLSSFSLYCRRKHAIQQTKYQRSES